MSDASFQSLPPVTPPPGYTSLDAVVARLWWTPAHLALAQALGFPRPTLYQFRAEARQRYAWLETAALDVWWSHWLLIADGDSTLIADSVRTPIAFGRLSASTVVADHELREVLGWDPGVLAVCRAHFNFPQPQTSLVADVDGHARSVTGCWRHDVDAWLANVRALLAPVSETLMEPRRAE